jgi:hypothetical protein
LFDAQAQYYVVKDDRFRASTDEADPVVDIEDVWRDNSERVQAQKEEITHDVPTGWTEGLVDNPKIVDVIQPDQDTHKVLRMSPRARRKRRWTAQESLISSYASTYNGMDRKDRDTSDWTISVKSHRWYLRLYYWMVDAAIHSSFLFLVDHLAKKRGEANPEQP